MIEIWLTVWLFTDDGSYELEDSPQSSLSECWERAREISEGALRDRHGKFELSVACAVHKSDEPA